MLRATDKITALYCRLSVEDMKEDKKGGKEDVSSGSSVTAERKRAKVLLSYDPRPFGSGGFPAFHFMKSCRLRAGD